MKIDIAPLIFVWIGSKFPIWGLDSLEFSYLNNRNRVIILLLDNNSISLKNLIPDFVDEYFLSDEFINSCNLEGDIKLNGNFWINSSKRLKIIYEFCKKQMINQLFHAELDNLIFNLQGLEAKLNKKGSGFFAPQDSPDRALASLIYCNNIRSISEIFKYFYSPFFANSEMHAIGFFSKYSDMFFALPTESFCEVNNKWLFVDTKLTDGIFDAAAVGQYIFGIDPQHQPYKPLLNMFENENLLIQTKDLNFYLKDNDLFIYYKNLKTSYKIYNLHIHSKKIKLAINSLRGKNKILENLNLGRKSLITNRHRFLTGRLRYGLRFLKNLLKNYKK